MSEQSVEIIAGRMKKFQEGMKRRYGEFRSQEGERESRIRGR